MFKVYIMAGLVCGLLARTTAQAKVEELGSSWLEKQQDILEGKQLRGTN
jgi:hypothetical protein